jgi:hypothetical protein
MGISAVTPADRHSVAGVAGAAAAMAMQFYMAVFDWPSDVGGKPPNSTLAFVPIASS